MKGQPAPRSPFDHLAEAGILGLVRLDERVVVISCHGKLAEFTAAGEDLCRDVAVFSGMRPDLLALQDDPAALFALPNVGIVGDDGSQVKLSFEAFWEAEARQYHLVVHRLGLSSAAELDLARQLRMRRIAEDHLRLAKAELMERQGLRELIVDHAPVPIAMFDRDMTCHFATRRWIEVFGASMMPLAGHFGLADLGNGDLDAGRRIQERCLAGETVTIGVEPYAARTGKLEWISWVHSPWRRANGTVGGIISFADIETQMTASRLELERKNAELERINRELESFSSVISHDLRAPLRSIEYAARDLRKAAPGDGPAADASCSQIERSVERMGQMLSDLLDYSRLGRVEGEEEELDVRALVAEIAASIPEAAAFRISCETPSPTMLLDRTPLDLVLRNLIENAIRHHDRDAGEVRVSIADEGERWLFRVSDDGPGIATAYHKLIFEPFRQLAARPGERHGGMGLALVAKTVALYGGRIEVLSDAARARGTTFEFSWPGSHGVHD